MWVVCNYEVRISVFKEMLVEVYLKTNQECRYIRPPILISGLANIDMLLISVYSGVFSPKAKLSDALTKTKTCRVGFFFAVMNVEDFCCSFDTSLTTPPPHFFKFAGIFPGREVLGPKLVETVAMTTRPLTVLALSGVWLHSQFYSVSRITSTGQRPTQVYPTLTVRYSWKVRCPSARRKVELKRWNLQPLFGTSC